MHRYCVDAEGVDLNFLKKYAGNLNKNNTL